MQRFKLTTFVFWLTLLALLLASGSRSTFAQVMTSAAIHGTVTDPSGAVIPNAKVTAANQATGISNVTSTDKNGYYIFPQLASGGPYTITITGGGFQSFVSSGLNLDANGNREIDATLKLGAEAQTVQVTANEVQVETSNTQLEQVATAAQLEEIPLEGRDPAGLQKLEPGVVESSDRFGSFSSNGNETPQNSYMVNGIDINDPALQDEGIQINPDALQEENIVTSTMNPEFGRNSGAVVNQVLKSGTNQFHGSGFEFYRDTFLTNGNYFSTVRPEFHQNLYGGTLGGPVFKNKLFFFLAYQGQRQRTGATDVQSTYDTDQFQGNFTNDLNYYSSAANSAGLTNNPLPFDIGSCGGPNSANPETWAQCFSSGTVNIPTSMWNSISTKLINKFVLPANYGAPDVNGQQDLAQFNPLNTYATDQGIIRVDYNITASDAIWASTIFMSSPATSTLTFGGGSFPGFPSSEGDHFKLFSASWTHTFSPKLLNELRASYYRNPFAAVGVAQVDPPSNYGFSINPQDPAAGVPYIGVGNYFSLGFSFEGPQPRLDTNLTYADNVTLVHGNHNLKFGASFEQFRVHNPFDVYNNGYYSFGGSGSYSSGDPIIDFAMGVPDAFYQTNNGFINAVAEELFAYGQDNYKLGPDVTLNFGLAWDIERPNENHQDGGLGIVCWSNSSSESKVFPGASPGLSFPGDPGCNNSGSPTTHYDRIGPRVGIAWSPASGPSAIVGRQGEHQFSVRLGFGVYYNRDQEEQSLQNLEDPPFLKVSYGAGDAGGSPSFANPFQDITGNAGASEANPFPLAPVTPTSTINWLNYLEEELAVFEPNYSVPYTYNYNLNLQRSIGPSMVAQIGYVGSASHRLASWFEGDPITPAGHDACLANPSCYSTPYYDRYFPQYMADTANFSGYPYYLSIGAQDTEGSSNYNSLQASLIKAPTHGLQFTLGYTYSHALDDGSGYESATGSAGRDHIYTPGFTYLNYGSSDFDARQRLVASYIYTIPVVGFMRSSFIAREALSGWGIAGVSAFQSGFPVGINMGINRSRWCQADSYFGCGDVPVYSGSSIQKMAIRSATNQYFNTSPFSAEPIGTFGNTSRNFFRGPGYNYTNLQLSKNVPINSDGTRYVQLRIEAFNAFNHANFGGPNGTFASPNFGKVLSVITSADPNGDPSPGRAVQLVGKIYF